ncbi:hypothetical protein AMJ82_06440 [candidate division TA06 bacterium SM23_40]|uniref:Uncharacterized protein n=1 Tax=candidate division TA06 bacterium SM23_40 TaxID=1703774 RepID=A0A0S8G8V0_UNCT6|nr:MAG: hypothetical protein AMJ82_06440 [candidate division TA06 bacterium SM23_40]
MPADTDSACCELEHAPSEHEREEDRTEAEDDQIGGPHQGGERDADQGGRERDHEERHSDDGTERCEETGERTGRECLSRDGGELWR